MNAIASSNYSESGSMHMKSIVSALIVGLLVGCSQPDSSHDATCEEACANLATRCGAAAPRCPTACQSLADEQRRCLATAASCGAAQTCLASEPSPDAGAVVSDGGSTPVDAGSAEPRRCGACLDHEYCVVIGSPTHCWSRPGCTTDCGDCLDLFVDGPCPAGTGPGCVVSSEGRFINCI